MGTEGVDAPGVDREKTQASPGRSAWWTRRRIVVVGSIAATMIGVIGIVVPLAVSAGERTSSVDSVDINTQGSSTDGEGLAVAADAAVASALDPVTPGLLAAAPGVGSASSWVYQSGLYAVPVDSPWQELFATGQCTNEHNEWLITHGKPMMPFELSADITNTATTGSPVVVSDIRAQGTLTDPPGDTVMVESSSCSGAGSEGVYATMALGLDPVAVFADCYDPTASFFCGGSSESVPIPGDPVVFEVGPGETAYLHLTWTQTQDFAGKFVATLSADGQSATVDLSPEGQELFLPVVTRPETILRPAYDGIMCQADATSGFASCGLDQWLAILAAG